MQKKRSKNIVHLDNYHSKTPEKISLATLVTNYHTTCGQTLMKI